MRNKGVQIALDKAAAELERTQETCERVSSRVIMARLINVVKSERRWHRRGKTYVSVVCTYALNANAQPSTN